MVKPVPEGFHTITPHITVKNAAQILDFYKKAFGAEEIARMPGPNGEIMHAEVRIGDSPLMLCDEFPDMGKHAPRGGTPVTLHVYVKDCDAFFDRAVKAGAKVIMPLQDMFWGDRYGQLEDPSGHHWAIATHKEDLTPEQIQKNAEKAFGDHSCDCC
jgi:uncharacterized glyoxalase superfamily protein PhnB